MDTRERLEQRRRRGPDVAVTVVLLVALGVLAALARFWGGLAGMVADECPPGPSGQTGCGPGIGLGADVGHHGPLVCWAVAAALAAVRVLRGAPAWWVPLAAVPVVLLSVGLGWWISLSVLP